LVRKSLKVLLSDINRQKRKLKEEGITIDGKFYNIEFLGKDVDFFNYRASDRMHAEKK